MTVDTRERLRLRIRGAVQGVGFRPWVYRQARELGLDGWVLNDAGGVVVEIEGGGNELRHFRELLTGGAPPRSVIHEVVGQPLAATGVSGFEIRQSREDGAKTAVVLPDAATCGECIEDTLDPSDRRFRYPFTNCTNCGPRFSIIRSLPYDRPNTTMARFRMCPACHGEYDDPENRRFHAQPNACPDCGPRLRLLYRDGIRADRHEALSAAVERLHKGGIVAVKGLGGFHLMVDGGDSRAVSRLRERKARYEKPLALMVADLEQARACCRISTAAAAALTAPEAPIVLLPRLANAAIAPEVAPNNPLLGLMLPPSPLHHLLLSDFGGPLVATSGNRSEEPICIDNDEAQERLAGIADLFLVHDRPIARYIDDSVLVVIRDEVQPLRRARGLAPLPVRLGSPVPTVLAVGGQLKNTIGLGLGRDVYLSQHIGDLETQLARDAFERTIGDFLALYEARPVAVAHDLHPDYASTRWAKDTVAGAGGLRSPSRAAAAHRAENPPLEHLPLEGLPLIAVQHHHAHLASCLAERGIAGPALGVTWDGTGYGTDGTIWGGEFLLGDARDFERVATLRPFRLPGGDAAVREPRRVALSLLWKIFGEEAAEHLDRSSLASFSSRELGVLLEMLRSRINSPVTTSAGRLFDGVAALIGVRQTVSYEGQAAMELEFLAAANPTDAYPVSIVADEPGPPGRHLDWVPLIQAILDDRRRGTAAGVIAARFHGALAAAIGEIALLVGQPRVALTGGCFQNRLLLELASDRLERDGFEVLLHRQVPANDGGVSLGQIAVAAARLENSKSST